MHAPMDFGSEWTSHIEDQVKAWTHDESQDNNDINRSITLEEVKDVMYKLKNNKSSSPENIPNELLKHDGRELVQSLTSLFNKILQNEVIPEEWKYRQITPLYKGKGKHDDLYNYSTGTRFVCQWIMLLHYTNVLLVHNERFPNVAKQSAQFFLLYS